MDNRDLMTAPQVTPPPPQHRPGPVERVRRFVRPRRRWCRFTRLLVAVTVAWLAFLATHLVVSGRVPLWAPVDLLPPLMWMAVPVGLMLLAPIARPVRWRLLTALAVACVLSYPISGLNLATLWYTPPPAPADAITVVSWNTEYWTQAWRRGGEGRDEGFYEYLRELDADVYLLKEYAAYDPSAPTVWLMASPVDYLDSLHRHFPEYEIIVSGWQITLSRLPVVGHKPLDLRPFLPEHLKEVPREIQHRPAAYTHDILRTDIEVDGTVVSFYNVHTLQPPQALRLYRADARDSNRDVHYRRVASLTALRTDVESNPNPVVVGADLNTSPAMGIRRLLSDRLVDHTRALDSLYPATWEAYGWRKELWRLDWLFTTDDVAVHSYEALDSRRLSDHRIQRAVVSFPGAGEGGR